MKKRFVFLLVTTGVLLRLAACTLAGGYPFAEEYEFSIPEDSLIKRINHFKETYPSYQVPKSFDLPDHKQQNSPFYTVYFYYKAEKKFLHCYVRSSPDSDSTAILALESFDTGEVVGSWKRVNSDLSFSENRAEKRNFEKRIIEKLR